MIREKSEGSFVYVIRDGEFEIRNKNIGVLKLTKGQFFGEELLFGFSSYSHGVHLKTLHGSCYAVKKDIWLAMNLDWDTWKN